MADHLHQLLRSDAQDNRDRILEVAREVFATDGLGVSMREVARRADVGPATLYRRFPSKRDLVVEAFMDEFHRCRGIVRTGSRDRDPWRGFCYVLTELSELQAQNQGFTEAFLDEYPEAVDVRSHRAETLRAVADLARRAQAQGSLRTDFVLADFIVFLTANRGLATTPRADRVIVARRFSALMLDAMRSSPAHRPLPRSVS